MRTRLAPLLADPSRTAVVTDFDGTLAPIVEDPSAARPVPGAAALLAGLARTFAVVAVVSGRPAAFLVDRLGGPGAAQAAGVHLVGLYGLERAAPDGTVVVAEEVAPWAPVVGGAATRLSDGAPDGVLVEAKGAAVTVHWRRAPGAAGWVAARVEAEAARTGLAVHAGRRSLELRPPVPVDKGTVVRSLTEGATAACYAGDDLGDLPAFAALRRRAQEDGMAQVSVCVLDEETAPEVVALADVTVRGPAGACALLAWLSEAARVPGAAAGG